MYSKIINPLTNRKVNIDSKLGLQILKNYLNNLSGGRPSNSLPIGKNFEDKLDKLEHEIIGESLPKDMDMNARLDYLEESQSNILWDLQCWDGIDFATDDEIDKALDVLKNPPEPNTTPSEERLKTHSRIVLLEKTIKLRKEIYKKLGVEESEPSLDEPSTEESMVPKAG